MKQNISTIIEHADALYAGREQIEMVRASVRQLESVATADDDFEISWRMGRALFFLGQEEERRDEAPALHARGVEACARAARLESRRVEGHFWLGVNRALQAQAANSLAALPLAWRAKRSLERAACINPAYHAAGPLRVLARLAHKLPRLVGGGYARARAEFARAIEIAPANTVTRLYFAEMLLDAGEVASARRELETLLSAPLDADWEFETKRDRSRAREMLEKMRSST
ncbi:MAG: tetratricopeptide repeat protein [Acidobacteria bacterium]|nr:tetratricopeptide repeat protein [Acidobacteriota bacterium]